MFSSLLILIFKCYYLTIYWQKNKNYLKMQYNFIISDEQV